ncbi:unnamed protein product [Peniophora sp. CBMAI 1063]|nr:unnamed protein product [Peniophora sp. CBMAI 1063]
MTASNATALVANRANRILVAVCAIELPDSHAVGLAAYLKAARAGPSPNSDDEDAPSNGRVVASGCSRVRRVLAAHVIDGTRHILVNWAGHSVPTWEIDDGEIKHNLSCAHLDKEVSDESLAFQEKLGPDVYTAFGGDLEELDCCSDATCNVLVHGLDYHTYYDASEKGTVSCSVT